MRTSAPRPTGHWVNKNSATLRDLDVEEGPAQGYKVDYQQVAILIILVINTIKFAIHLTPLRSGYESTFESIADIRVGKYDVKLREKAKRNLRSVVRNRGHGGSPSPGSAGTAGCSTTWRADVPRAPDATRAIAMFRFPEAESPPSSATSKLRRICCASGWRGLAG
jgi:hypothetical protein